MDDNKIYNIKLPEESPEMDLKFRNLNLKLKILKKNVKKIFKKNSKIKKSQIK